MTQLSELAMQNLHAVFNERNSQKRRAALEKIWARDGILWTAVGVYVGHAGVDNAVLSGLKSYPEFDFSAGSSDEICDAARLGWSFGAAGEVPALTGLDVIAVAGGRIQVMYRFLDGAAF